MIKAQSETINVPLSLVNLAKEKKHNGVKNTQKETLAARF